MRLGEINKLLHSYCIVDVLFQESFTDIYLRINPHSLYPESDLLCLYVSTYTCQQYIKICFRFLIFDVSIKFGA